MMKQQFILRNVENGGEATNAVGAAAQPVVTDPAAAAVGVDVAENSIAEFDVFAMASRASKEAFQRKGVTITSIQPQAIFTTDATTGKRMPMLDEHGKVVTRAGAYTVRYTFDEDKDKTEMIATAFDNSFATGKPLDLRFGPVKASAGFVLATVEGKQMLNFAPNSIYMIVPDAIKFNNMSF